MALTPDEMRQGTEEFYAAMGKKDLDDVLSRLADGVVDHQIPPGMPPGREGAKAIFGMMFSAVPDGKYEIRDMIVSGDKVAIRSGYEGTQTGEMFGMPATGKHFSVESIDIVQVNDDKLVTEHWGVTDVMGMMMQVGLVEPPPQPEG
jgi:steroid delta-isomerase-like uncharacterized protein